MGCDIHVYVEFSRDGNYWQSLTDNAGSRNYEMFGFLAGVRGGDALIEPRGMPEGKMSWKTESGYWVNVAPDDHPEWGDLDGWTSKNTADKWVANGYSKPDYVDDVLKRVSGPDWHSHSWLTADEVRACVDAYRKQNDGKAPTEWVAILGAMNAIEANGDKTRVVFWFDN